jgi:hypothetical protein
MIDLESGSMESTTTCTNTTTPCSEDANQENSGAPKVLAQKTPERKLLRSISTRALPGLVLHVFQIEADGALQACKDPYTSLADALVAGRPENEKNGENYWVDVDADERDRDELSEWIQELQLGSFVTDLLTRPANGTSEFEVPRMGMLLSPTYDDPSRCSLHFLFKSCR